LRHLGPCILAVEGRDFWLATHELFAVDRRLLRQAIASVSDSPQRDHCRDRLRVYGLMNRQALQSARYRTTPEMQHGLWRGGLSLSLRKQRAAAPA
jgi:hypothetical protein